MSTKKIVLLLAALGFALLSWRGAVAFPENAAVMIGGGVVAVAICLFAAFKTGE